MQFSADTPDIHFDEVEPEIILPEQVFDALRQGRRQSGERRLLVSVVADALRCFERHVLSNTRKGRALFGDAEAWLMQGDTGAPLEFEDVCGFLGLDVEHIRAKLRRWRARRMREAFAGRVLVHRASGGSARKRVVGE